MTKNKTWTLTPTHSLTLAPPNKRGECRKCQIEKDIWLIADTPYEVWHYCWSHSLDTVYKLEQSNYPVKNKSQIVKEIRTALRTDNNSEIRSSETTSIVGD
ncbi:hypothetical protein [endosymbiont DhMRE of Dentiscutata heterogama]|uniref:hypothetical protein n=1 Tax=endosymbiont DhMRE of Dentiscutata heterogama TaxID=1609546 RepID=UPI002AD5536B|nr:hypothetical protein [endosymbiont DhMRE of Dentiscutata heterogama]